MNGLEKIYNGTKELMEEIFGKAEDIGGGWRSFAEHLGVAGANAIVEAVLTRGLHEELPYPVLQFHITLAHNVPKEAEADIYRSLNELNNVLSVGEYPSFGHFSYYPKLKQVYYSYRLPVHPESPEGEISNVRYFFGVLLEQLDLFADYILFLCNNEGRMVPMDEYIDYLSKIKDIDDIEKRMATLEEKLRAAGYDIEE